MSTDGPLCKMAWTALRSPSATAFRRGEAIILVERCREETDKDQEAKEESGGYCGRGESDVDVV